MDRKNSIETAATTVSAVMSGANIRHTHGGYIGKIGKLLIAIVICIIFANCGGEKKQSVNTDIPVLKRADFEISEGIKFDDPDYFEKTEFVKLESTDESILGEISQMEVFENHIYILDQKGTSLKKFDMTGKYIQDIGRAGQGPGEYIAVNTFYINPLSKIINVFDPMKSSVLRYDLSGKHEETIKLGLPDLAYVGRLSFLNEDEIFCFSNTNWRDNCKFSILNEKDYTAKCLYHYPVKSDEQISFHTAVHPYTIIDGEVHYVLMFSDTVYSYGKGEVSNHLLIESGKPALEDSQIATIGSENKNYFFNTILSVLKTGKYTVGLMNIFESDSYLCCDFHEYPDPGYLSKGAILWNKMTNRGIYMPMEYPAPTPCFGSIYYCFDNTFVRIWHAQNIEFFKEHTNEGDLYSREDFPQKVWDAIDNYNEDDDNPILIFYTMKSQ